MSSTNNEPKSPESEVRPPSDLNVVEDESTSSSTSTAEGVSKKPPSSPHTLPTVPAQEVKNDDDDDDDGDDLEVHPPINNTATSIASPVTNTQIPNVAASENEQKLNTLIEAFPTVDREICEYVLETHRGDVEASFIALLEISDPDYKPDVQTQAPANSVVPPALPRRRESDLAQGVENINLGGSREIDPALLHSTTTSEQQLIADADFARTLAAMDEYRARDRQNVRTQQQQQQQEEEVSFATEFKDMMDEELPKIKERFNVAADATKKKVTEWYNTIKTKAEQAQAQRAAAQQAAGPPRERRAEPINFESRLDEEEPLSRHRVTPPLQTSTPPLPVRPYNTTDVSSTETSTNDRRTTVEDSA